MISETVMITALAYYSALFSLNVKSVLLLFLVLLSMVRLIEIIEIEKFNIRSSGVNSKKNSTKTIEPDLISQRAAPVSAGV